MAEAKTVASFGIPQLLVASRVKTLPIQPRVCEDILSLVLL
jgi:hypothetical protein